MIIFHGGNTLWGLLNFLVPLRLYLTGSYQLWADTKLHPSIHELWRSFCYAIGSVLAKGTELEDINEYQGQDLTVNVTNSRRYPDIYGVPLHMSSATRALWHWKNIFMVHRMWLRSSKLGNLVLPCTMDQVCMNSLAICTENFNPEKSRIPGS